MSQVKFPNLDKDMANCIEKYMPSSVAEFKERLNEMGYMSTAIPPEVFRACLIAATIRLGGLVPTSNPRAIINRLERENRELRAKLSESTEGEE